MFVGQEVMLRRLKVDGTHNSIEQTQICVAKTFMTQGFVAFLTKNRKKNEREKHDKKKEKKRLFMCVGQEVMLRRLKVEVMAQLPPKRRQVVRLPAPKPSDWPPTELPVKDSEGGASAHAKHHSDSPEPSCETI